jgi:methyl-accepting chemotaxis protein
VIGTTALAVALACVGFAIHQARSSRATVLAGLEGLAEMIGFNAMLPLLAGDPAPVESTLLALTSNSTIEAAAVYTRDGRLFARFARDYEGAPTIAESAPAAGTWSDAGALILVREIAAGGEAVGTVLLRASLEPMRRQLAGTALVAGSAFVLCLAPALLGTTRLRRELSAPLAELASGAGRMAGGDFGARVALERGDEIGLLAEAFNAMADRLRALIGEVGRSARAVLEGMGTLREASRRSHAQAQTQRSSVDRTSSAIERTEVSIEAVGRATDKLSECTSATAASANQVEASTRNVRESVDLLFELISETASALTQSVESIRQVGTHASHLDHASARTESSVEQLAASVKSVEDEAAGGLALSRETAEGAERGQRAVGETEDAIGAIDARFGALQAAIGDLAKRSSDIGAVVEVIEKVAAETNLLSLNASIVASQAGEHGRPFSVVASRIGLLAERTSGLTGEIGKLVRSVQHSTEQAVAAAREGSESVALGVKLSREAGEVLARIMVAAGESAERVQRIADASAHQSQALGEVGSAFRAVREGMLQIRGAVQEQNAATGRVHQTMQRTRDLADRVQRATDEQATAVGHITRTIQEIHDVTQQVRDVSRTQSNDARQILHALELFREIAGRNVEDAQSVQRVIELLGERAQALELALGGLRLEANEEGSR